MVPPSSPTHTLNITYVCIYICLYTHIYLIVCMDGREQDPVKRTQEEIRSNTVTVSAYRMHYNIVEHRIERERE